MLKRRLSILSGTAKFLIRFLCCIVIGWSWLHAVPLVFIAKTPNRHDLKQHFTERLHIGDLLDFYEIAREIQISGAEENPALGERYVLFARIGDVGALWIWPAFGVLWGLSAILKKTKGRTLVGSTHK